MDDKKICFIMCVNDAALMDEAIYYLNRLEVPEGYVTDLLTIEGAPSMAEGYNEGMRSSDAKYKIYLHQDVFIIESFVHSCSAELQIINTLTDRFLLITHAVFRCYDYSKL